MYDYREYYNMMNEPREVTIPKFWIHIGTDELYKEWFRPIHNAYGFNKPLGGIWASPLNLEDGNVSDWQRASRDMGFKQPTVATVLEFNKRARICVIDTQADLINLAKEVGLQQSPFDFDTHLTIISLDFVKVAEMYDVIYLTSRGHWGTRTPMINHEYNLYGWDCESCVILNFDAISHQRKVKLNRR